MYLLSKYLLFVTTNFMMVLCQTLYIFFNLFNSKRDELLYLEMIA